MNQNYDYVSPTIAYHFALEKKENDAQEIDIPDQIVEVFIFKMKDDTSEDEIFEYKTGNFINHHIYGLIVEVEIKTIPVANSAVFRMLPDRRYSPDYFRNDESMIILFQMLSSSLTDPNAQQLSFKDRFFPLLINFGENLGGGRVGNVPTNIGREMRPLNTQAENEQVFYDRRLTVGSYEVTDMSETIGVLGRSGFRPDVFYEPWEKIRKFLFCIPSAPPGARERLISVDQDFWKRMFEKKSDSRMRRQQNATPTSARDVIMNPEYSNRWDAYMTQRWRREDYESPT